MSTRCNSDCSATHRMENCVCHLFAKRSCRRYNSSATCACRCCQRISHHRTFQSRMSRLATVVAHTKHLSHKLRWPACYTLANAPHQRRMHSHCSTVNYRFVACCQSALPNVRHRGDFATFVSDGSDPYTVRAYSHVYNRRTRHAMFCMPFSIRSLAPSAEQKQQLQQHDDTHSQMASYNNGEIRITFPISLYQCGGF